MARTGFFQEATFEVVSKELCYQFSQKCIEQTAEGPCRKDDCVSTECQPNTQECRSCLDSLGGLGTETLSVVVMVPFFVC